MIPKTIHYFWFGENPKPKLVQKCIRSWKKYCPDYEIIEWNESNYDVTINLFTKQAFESKKWAFVTDFARLDVLYRYGGIYMDTDVEVVASLDQYLNHKAFSGFESPKIIPTAIMGAEKENDLIRTLLSYYTDRPFIVDGKMDMKTNCTIITNMLSNNGFVANNTYQEVCEMALYPNDYFCPKSYADGIIYRTKNTASIHHFNSSWCSEEKQQEKKARWKAAKWEYYRYAPNRFLMNCIGKTQYEQVRHLIKKDH